MPEPPVPPVRSDAPPPTTETRQRLWPEPTATSQIDPARLPTAGLFAPSPPVHPIEDQAIVRLEGVDPRTTGGQAGLPITAVGEMTPNPPLLTLDHIGEQAELPMEAIRRNPIVAVFSRDPDHAQTLYRRQTVWAGILLLVLLIVGAVTFPRSWGDPGPGIAVETDRSGTGSDPASPIVDGVGPLVDSNPDDGDGANRGAIAGTLGSRDQSRGRPAATTAGTSEPEGEAEPSSSTTTTSLGPETSATVGPSGPSTSCPGAVPVAGCTTTRPDPDGPTTTLIEVSTSSTRVAVGSSSTTNGSTTTRPTTTRPTTTRRTTTTARPTTTRRTTTTRPTTTTRRTTTTRPTTTTRRTTTTQPTTTTTQPTTTEATTTTTESTTTTEAQETTSSTLTESTGSPSLPGQCQGDPPPVDCQPEP